MAVQGSVIARVADHRKAPRPHRRRGDPHSPHVGHGDGVGGVLRGSAAHTGWLLEHGRADWKRYAPTLYDWMASSTVAVSSVVLDSCSRARRLSRPARCSVPPRACSWEAWFVFLVHHVT
jgi:hypothetical protein